MRVEDIQAVGVIGAGIMGHGIAEVCAIAGYPVYLKDVDRMTLDKAEERVQESLSSLARKGKVKGDQVTDILKRIHYCVDYGDFIDKIQVCIESVPENMGLKKRIFHEIDERLSADAIIATNTSTMSITELASATCRPSNVIGMHFFNPVVIYDPVEVIKGDGTSETTLRVIKGFTERIGKLPIMILKDVAGFMINRVQAPSQVLISRAVEKGFATPSQIDAMAKKVGMPMGPFELMDLLGLDVIKDASDYLAEKLGPEFSMCSWVRELVENRHFGKKVGRGIFDYSSGKPKLDLDNVPDPEKISIQDIIAVQINEASKLIEAGVIEDAVDVDITIMTGTGNSAGIFGLLAADRQGVINRLTKLADLYQVEMFKPNALLQTMPIPNARKALKERKKRARAS